MPLRRRICVVAAKSEVTAGTAETLAAADAAFIAYNWKLDRDVPVDQRPGGTGFQQHTAVTGPRLGRATFETDEVGSGVDNTPPFWMATLAPACLMDLTGDVLACGTTTRTLTIAGYIDGKVEKIVGAAGTFVITRNAGRAGRIAWTFTGKLADDADVAVLAPTYPTVVPPRWAGGTCTIHGAARKCSTFVLDRGAEIVMREDPADVTGYIAAHGVDAGPFITCDPESDLVATTNWQSIMQAHTEGAVSCATGGAAGNVLTVASSTAQITEAPHDERNKLLTNAIRLQLNGTAGFTITQT
jgi:hypothetical protein